MKVYAIVDLEANAVVSVFQSFNDASAERSFLSLLTGPSSVFSDWPEQFAVFPVCDLEVSDDLLTVSRQGNEDLVSNGFKVDMYKVSKAVKRGSEYDKRYLKVLRDERAELSLSNVNSLEDKGGSENG